MTISANIYYCYERSPIMFNFTSTECLDRDTLANLIHNNDLEGLKNSAIIQHYGINYRFGALKETALHIAYSYNRPAIVNWLLENGASEQICSTSGRPPIAYIHKDYMDLRPRIINKLIKKYFKKAPSSSSKAPHHLFDVISKFIRKWNWCYCDSFNIENKPFRDDDRIILFGLPSFSYNVNCMDLSNLFIAIAKNIGITAKEFTYVNYRSISSQEKVAKQIEGEFKFFDGSRLPPFRFDFHSVVLSENHYFDLTLMCKYQHPLAVLAS